MNGILGEKWGSKYGILVTDVAMENIGTTDEYTKIIKDIEAKNTETRMLGQTYSDNMTGTMAAATGEAMKNASKNENGAMMGFAGMNLAQGAGSNIMSTVSNIEGNKESTGGMNFCPNCGNKNDGANFCGNCGAKLK